MKKFTMNTVWARGWPGVILLGLLTTIPATAETLHQAWEVALGVNHGLKAAQEETVAAAQQLEAARAARMPGVSLEAGYTALDNAPAMNTGVGGGIQTAEKESASYKAVATLPLYTNGQISNNIDAADAAFQASRIQTSGKNQDLKLQVAEAFVGVLRAGRGLEVASSHVASLRAHTQDVENMHEQGMVSRNDLLAAQVTRADAQQEAIKAKNALDLAKSAYNRLLGRPLHQEGVLDDLQPEPFDESLEMLTEQALRQRHELLALQEQRRALRHQADGIRAKTGPQIALNGGYEYMENQYQAHEGKWFVNVGLQWKLFDGGVIRHQASASDRQAIVLQEQYDDLVSNVALQVRQYWLDVQETGKRIQVTKKAIAQAEENLKVNRDRYESGISTNTEVLDAETLRIRSQNNHANAVYDAVVAALRLKRAVGEL